MLSQARIEELRAVVRKYHPDFGTRDFKPVILKNPTKIFWDPPQYGIPFQSKIGRFPINLRVPQITTITMCCGLSAFQNMIGDMHGLYPLSNYTELEKAVFALWLNDNPSPGYAALVASSASPNPNKYDASEQVLLDSGFVPVMRGYNLCHGPNYVTMWTFQFTKPDQTPLAAVPAEVLAPVKAAPRRKSIGA